NRRNEVVGESAAVPNIRDVRQQLGLWLKAVTLVYVGAGGIRRNAVGIQAQLPFDGDTGLIRVRPVGCHPVTVDVARRGRLISDYRADVGGLAFEEDI